MRIEPRDARRLLQALEVWAHGDDLLALRTRAFVLLLWDGAIRTSEALALNVEAVVKDPAARRPAVARIVELRSRAASHRHRSIVLSARARGAMAEYVQGARDANWWPAEDLRGPLFVSSSPVGACQRLSQRSAIHSWDQLQKLHVCDCTREYELDDVVYTGRLAYLEAAAWDTASLSAHAGISRRWAAEHRSRPGASPRDIMAKLDRQR